MRSIFQLQLFWDDFAKQQHKRNEKVSFIIGINNAPSKCIMKQNEFIFHTSKIYFLAFTVIPKVYSQFLTCRFFQILGRIENDQAGRLVHKSKDCSLKEVMELLQLPPLNNKSFEAKVLLLHIHEEMSLRTKTTQRHETSFNITLQSIL